MELVELITKNGADVNSIDKIHGQTPLHYCVAVYSNKTNSTNVPLNRLEIANLLIENGANQDILDKYENTPLQLALRNGLSIFCWNGISTKKTTNKMEF